MSLLHRLASAASTLFRGAGAASFSQFLEVTGGERKDSAAEPYNAVVPVRVCVAYIGQCVSGLPFRVSTPDDEVIETGPLARLARRPNAGQGIADFWMQVVVGWLLFSRLHLRVTGSSVLDLQVEAINPLQMQPIVEAGRLAGWWYTPVQGARERLDLDEVYTEVATDPHNPLTPWEGVSAAKAAGLAIAQYHQSDVANLTSLQNDVQPAGALTTEQNLTEDQKRDLKGQLKAEHAGAKNRRNVMLLEGGLTWQQMASTFAEMEFMAGRSMNTEAICASFGLKAILFFGQAGGGMNDDQARSAAVQAHQSVVRPLARKLAEAFNSAVIGRLGGDQSLTMRDGLRADWSRRGMTGAQRRHAGYAAAREAAQAEERVAVAWFDDTGEAITTELWQGQAAGAKTWFDMGVPLNDIIAATDAPFEEHPHGDVPRIPAGLMDARAFDEPGGGDLPGDPGTPDEPAVIVPQLDDDVTEAGRSLTAVQRADDERLAALWRALRAQSEPFEKAMVGPYGRHLMTLRAECLANLRRVDPARLAAAGETSPLGLHWVELGEGGTVIDREAVVRLTAVQRDLLGEILFDLRAAVDGRWRAVSRFVRGALQAGGDQAMAEAAAAEGSDTPSPFEIKPKDNAEAELLKRQVSMAGLAKRQQDRLRAVLAQGLQDGKPIKELGDVIGKQFNLETGRGALVARQETGTAIEAGRQEGRVRAGVPARSWLWSRKETGRPNHAATERATMAEPIPTDEAFVIEGSGAVCMFPRGTGRAEEDVNCGCTTIGRYPGDQIREARLAAGLSRLLAANAPEGAAV